jgi:hypothetical protein
MCIRTAKCASQHTLTKNFASFAFSAVNFRFRVFYFVSLYYYRS